MTGHQATEVGHLSHSQPHQWLKVPHRPLCNFTPGSPQFADNWIVSHDFLYVPAGAEVVTAALANDVLGGAPVLYLTGQERIAHELGLPPGTRPVLNRRVCNRRTFRSLAPLYPVVLQHRHPIHANVVASSYAFAHHLPRTGKLIVYCHSPLRQVWSGYADYSSAGQNLTTRLGIRLLSGYLRKADVNAARSADRYIATNETVAARVRRYYNFTDVPIVPPPVDTKVFSPRASAVTTDEYVWVGRITEPYKRLGLALDAFQGMTDRVLNVVGDGPDRIKLERLAPSNVRFHGWLPPTRVADLFRSSRALVFPSADDFGLVPVEAMSCGTSVIALREGGAVETVIDGVNGVFFQRADVQDLINAVKRHAAITFDPTEIVASVRSFSRATFCERMRELIDGMA